MYKKLIVNLRNRYIQKLYTFTFNTRPPLEDLFQNSLTQFYICPKYLLILIEKGLLIIYLKAVTHLQLTNGFYIDGLEPKVLFSREKILYDVEGPQSKQQRSI